MPKTEKRVKKKKRLPCDLDEDFLEEIKDAVVYLQCGPEPTTSIRSFVEDACRAKIEAVKVQYKKKLRSGKIPKRKKVRPRQGRPMS